MRNCLRGTCKAYIANLEGYRKNQCCLQCDEKVEGICIGICNDDNDYVDLSKCSEEV